MDTIIWTIIGAFIGFFLGLIPTVYFRKRDNQLTRNDFMVNLDEYVNRVFNALMDISIVESKWSESVRRIKEEINSYPVKSVRIKLTKEQSNLIMDIDKIKNVTLGLLIKYLAKDDSINFCAQDGIGKPLVNEFKKERNNLYELIREERTKWLDLTHKTMNKPKRNITVKIRVTFRKLLRKK